MADALGRISIVPPTASGLNFPSKPAPSGTLPQTDFAFAFSQDRPVISHVFGSLDAKCEQRFKVGLGPRRFGYQSQSLSYTDRRTLAAFWESVQGSWKNFTYYAPTIAATTPGAPTFTPTLVNFEYAPLSFDYLLTSCRIGLTFVEVFDAASAPTYTVASTSTRFPSTALSAALLSQVQEVVPLIHIKVRESAVPDNIYLSDRRCTVAGQLYLPRLQNIGEPGSDVLISQSISGAADNVQLTLGNADGAITKLANDTDLRLATVSFSLYHVQSQVLLNLWQGFITDFVNDGSPSFQISCSDGLYQVNQQYPVRTIDRQCWKTFNDGTNCPYSAQSTNHGGDPLSCDFYFNSTNGCQAHGMDKFFGAHPAQPQRVAGLAQVVGGLRNAPTSTSIVSDTVWGNALAEIYCNDHGDPLKSFSAPCAIVSGRRETNNNGDPQFYDALGIVGQGPIGAYTGTNPANSTDGWYVFKPNADGLFLTIGPLLDGFTAHGFSLTGGNAIKTSSGLGLRCIHGNDPETNPFCLTQLVGGDTSQRAAGTAFIELRRVDADQAPSLTEQHQMTAQISQGLAGYTWDSGGNRTLTAGLTNPFWISVNLLLRATGTFQAASSTQLGLFDLSSLANADGMSGTAQIAALTVPPLLGTASSEIQFEFQGNLNSQKPLRDWLTEVLSCCLGYFAFDYGRLRLGIRENASATDAFTIGNILFQSLRLQPFNATFERLQIDFADAAYQYQTNTASYVDKTHAAYMGRANAPLTARMKSVGGANLSQMLRVAATRTREEIGGVTPAEWAAARLGSWKTTILALSTAVGQVVSMTHADMPGGVGKFRIQSWRLMKDWSIEIQGKTVTPSMYDLTVGPKPTDVVPAPLPAIWYPIPFSPAWAPFETQAQPTDPLFASEFSFISDQEYTTLANGNPSAALVVTGKLPVTAFSPSCPPPTYATIAQSPTGGSLPGGVTVAVTFSAIDTNGLPSPSAQIAIVDIPAGTNTNTITISGIVWPAVAGLTQAQVFASTSEDLLCAQNSLVPLTDGGGHVYTPGTLTLVGPLVRSSWALPTPYVSKVRVKAKLLSHSGIAGVGVTSVTSGTIVSSDMVDMSVGAINLTGRVISVIGRPIGPTPFASFLITSHNPVTGTFAVTPDPTTLGTDGTALCRALDAIVIRNKADAPNVAPFLSITDTGYKNSTDNYTGLTVNAETGNVLRVIAGTGRGQLRKILSNTSTTLTWDQPLTLDSTSVWIVEAPAYIWQADFTDLSNGDRLKSATAQMPAENLLEQPVLICGFTVDTNGVESPDGPNPFREDWVFGAQATREVDLSGPMLQTDGLVIFDTSIHSANIDYTCLPFTSDGLANRTFIWQRKNAGDGHIVNIIAAAGDAFDAAGTTTLQLIDNANGPTGTIVFKVYG